jgi:hypothetical protein
MIDRRVLLLVALLAFYVLFLQPQAPEILILADQVALVKGKISREQAIANEGKDLPIFLAEVHAQAERNRNLLYQGEAGTSQALGRFQEFVKQATITSGGTLVSLNWGKPEKMETAGMSRLPISCRLLLSPPQLSKFLTILFSEGPLVIVENANARVSEDNVSLNLVLSAFLRSSDRQDEADGNSDRGETGT